MPMLAFAEWYATVYRWGVFPLAMRQKEPLFRSAHLRGQTCKGECGKVGHGVYDATTDLEKIRTWWGAYPEANIGLAVPEDCIAVDVDARNHGPRTLEMLEQSYSILPSTVTNLTGSGGGSKHKLLTVPPGTVLRGSFGADYPGLDLKKSPGGYLVVPPSVHPSGGVYQWEDVFDGDALPEVAPAPLWLLALLHGGKGHSNGVVLEQGTVIQNGARNTTFTSVGGALRRNGADFTEIRTYFDLLNARTKEPLTAAELDRIAHNLERYAPAEPPPQVHINRAPLGQTNMHLGDDVPWQPPPGAWLHALTRFKGSMEVKQNVTNFMLILENDPYWSTQDNVLWWDTVRVRPMRGEREIDDAMIIEIADLFGRSTIAQLPVTNTRLLQTTLMTACKKRKRDLLREWVEALPPWDKQPRMHTWVQTYAGVEDNAYTRDVSRVILVSMIARVLHPGCHYRFVAIMQGEEDIGKSLLIKALCSPTWYVDLGLNLESKEAHMMLQGVWVAELGELHSMGNTEVTRLKSFITMDEDSYIPKYGNLRETTERRAIFIGTTNQDVFLKDTGNTRFLPIKLQGQCDRVGFEKVREQLFAEAREYYGAHPEDWWDLSDEGHALAQEERELRRLVNPYETKLHEWLEYERWNTVYHTGQYDLEDKPIPVIFTPNETSWPEIAQWCLGMKTPAEWKDRSLQMQIASALRAIGWRVGQVWRYGRNMKVWKKEDTTPF